MSIPRNLDQLYTLGDRDYYATVNRFNNQLRIHIRKYFEPQPAPGEVPPFLPTKFGVALTVKEWNDLLNYVPVVNDIIEQNQETPEEPIVDNVQHNIGKTVKNKRFVKQKPYERNVWWRCYE